MAKVIGVEGMTAADLHLELQKGGRFVIYQYCISVIVMTFKRASNVYFLRAGESGVIRGLPFTLLSMMLGWWGFPWGPIYTLESLAINLQGGRDVTQEILALLAQSTTPQP
ncbi:MAG TPA: hypothetical protein ENI95_12940 [Chloroflexi bacterium]|nr:hypothetical protein [Chloroflexota bacterium]